MHIVPLLVSPNYLISKISWRSIISQK